MRTYLLALVLALLLGALLMWLMQAGSGYVLVSLGQTAVEMSFWSAGILLLLLVVGRVLCDRAGRMVGPYGGAVELVASAPAQRSATAL